MSKKAELSVHQKNVIEILRNLGGWAGHYQIWNHGGNTSAALALVKKGLVERRDLISARGYPFVEYRLIERRSGEPADLQTFATKNKDDFAILADGVGLWLSEEGHEEHFLLERALRLQERLEDFVALDCNAPCSPEALKSLN